MEMNIKKILSPHTNKTPQILHTFSFLNPNILHLQFLSIQVTLKNIDNIWNGCWTTPQLVGSIVVEHQNWVCFPNMQKDNNWHQYCEHVLQKQQQQQINKKHSMDPGSFYLIPTLCQNLDWNWAWEVCNQLVSKFLAGQWYSWNVVSDVILFREFMMAR